MKFRDVLNTIVDLKNGIVSTDKHDREYRRRYEDYKQYLKIYHQNLRTIYKLLGDPKYQQSTHEIALLHAELVRLNFLHQSLFRDEAITKSLPDGDFVKNALDKNQQVAQSLRAGYGPIRFFTTNEDRLTKLTQKRELNDGQNEEAKESMRYNR